MNDLSKIREKVIPIILQAGNITKKYFNSSDLTHHEKSEFDIVTQADLEVDTFLQKELQKEFPQSKFLTEETAPKDFSSFKNESNLWVIDPIDGTSNFSRGHPNFAISIAYVNESETQLGVVYVPISDYLYSAQVDKKHGLLNNEHLSVSKIKELRKCVVGCGWSWDFEKRSIMIRWLDTLTQNVRQVKAMGSCVSDVASLAQGKIDVFVHSGIKPWDIAAVSLLVQKAGGIITKPDGSKWNIFDSDFVATNAILQNPIIDLLCAV